MTFVLHARAILSKYLSYRVNYQLQTYYGNPITSSKANEIYELT